MLGPQSMRLVHSNLQVMNAVVTEDRSEVMPVFLALMLMYASGGCLVLLVGVVCLARRAASAEIIWAPWWQWPAYVLILATWPLSLPTLICTHSLCWRRPRPEEDVALIVPHALG